MATQTQTNRTQAQRKASAQKAAATRRRKAAARSRSATKAAETRAQAELNTLQAVQQQAERAALIPLGAALTARDAVLEAAAPYVAGRESAEREIEKVGKRVQVSLKRFERRGSTEVKRFEREAKKTRTRVGKDVKALRADVTKQVKPITTQADFVASRAQNLLQTGLTAGQKAATTVQERIASVA